MRKRRSYPAVEMQMGPMIDMVFLLLVFFMVTAKPIKQEADVSLTLPGFADQDAPLDIPDEQRIDILADGQIILNEQNLDNPQSRDLPALVATLTRYRLSAESNHAEALVTIGADDALPHQRVVDVLNACAKAGLRGVTFASDSLASEETE